MTKPIVRKLTQTEKMCLSIYFMDHIIYIHKQVWEEYLQIHPHFQKGVESESSTVSVSALGVPAGVHCYFLNGTGFSWSQEKASGFYWSSIRLKIVCTASQPGFSACLECKTDWVAFSPLRIWAEQAPHCQTKGRVIHTLPQSPHIALGKICLRLILPPCIMETPVELCCRWSVPSTGVTTCVMVLS